jgi:hypothetical protein
MSNTAQGTWNGLTMSCHCAILTFFKKKEFGAMAGIIEVQQKEELFGMDWYDPTCYATEILDAK